MLQGLVQKREDISRCVLSATEHPMGIRRIFLVAAWLPRFSMTCRTEADIKVEFAMLLLDNCFYFLFSIIPFKGYFSASRGPQCVPQPRWKMRTYIFEKTLSDSIQLDREDVLGMGPEAVRCQD